MPDTSIDIFIDSSFLTTKSGAPDIDADVSFIGADSIGLRSIIVEYEFYEPEVLSDNVIVEVYTSISGALISGTNTIGCVTSFGTAPFVPVLSGTSDVYFNYRTATISGGFQGIEDTDFSYFVTSSGSYRDTSKAVRVLYTVGRDTIVTYSIVNDYLIALPKLADTSSEVDYIAGGYYNPLISGSPIDQFITYEKDDIRQFFTMGQIVGSTIGDVDNEVFFAGYPMTFSPEKYTYRFHLVSGDEGTTDSYDWEMAVISGTVNNIDFDFVSGISGTNYFKLDSICGVSGIEYVDFESEMVSGGIGYFYKDLVCGASGTQGYGFDIDLFSLKISNFSLAEEGYSAASGTICVDVTDDVYNVVTSGTYFIVDDIVISGALFTPITDGYRMCYDSDDDFAALSGATTITVHGENDNGDSLEVSFYLTSGYIVEYEHRINPYDYDKQVVVRGSAENMSGCPETGTDAYWFTTVPSLSRDVGASIVGVPLETKDLSASITPTTGLIYFYGKVFRIEVRAKDFAGNIMEPYIFEFKIEDKPE